jgi:hypothetical protein
MSMTKEEAEKMVNDFAYASRIHARYPTEGNAIPVSEKRAAIIQALTGEECKHDWERLPDTEMVSSWQVCHKCRALGTMEGQVMAIVPLDRWIPKNSAKASLAPEPLPAQETRKGG